MNDENLKNGKQFQKGQSGNPAGRKPNIVKKYMKDYDFTKQDIDNIFTTLLLTPHPELQKSLKNPKLPAGVAAFISGILHDIKRGDARVTNLVLDRVYGKAKESHEHSGGLHTIIDDVTSLPPDERKQRIADYMQKAHVQ